MTVTIESLRRRYYTYPVVHHVPEQPPGRPTFDEDLIRARLEDYRERHKVPGVVVGLFDARGPRDTIGVGRLSAELPDGTVSPSAVFSTYSIAKMLNSTMLCMLHDAGATDLDAPLTTYLPDLRLRPGSNPAALTVRHLLSNSSGLVPDRTDHEGLSRNPGDLGREIIDEVRRLPHIARPGEVFAYSNAGMSLAGHVAERVTGTPFADLMREHLIEPLGMERTTYDPAVAMTHPLMQHHTVDAAGRLEVMHRPKAGARHQPAGLCFSTVPDLARLGALHLRQARQPHEPDPLAGLSGVALAHEPVVDVFVETSLEYGLGALITRRGGQRCVGHEGFNPGMWCKLIAVPSRGVGLVWADNRGPELRTVRYRIIDDILAQVGVARVDRRQSTVGALPVSPLIGRYTRLGAAPIEIRPVPPGRGCRDDDLDVMSGDRQIQVSRSSGDVWTAAPEGALEPPWMPHMDSTRLAVGFRFDRDGDTVSHLHFNGLPYRRADG